MERHKVIIYDTPYWKREDHVDFCFSAGGQKNLCKTKNRINLKNFFVL